MKRPVIVPFFISHQGCPHRCVFCNQGKISSVSENVPTADEILEKVNRYTETAGGRPVEVAFFGGTFTALPVDVQERLLEPLQRHIHEGLVREIRISTRPDAITSAEASFLRERGVGTVEVGVQSLDENVLRLSGRGHTGENVAIACRLLKEKGLRLGIQLMAGLPGDSPAACTATMTKALQFLPDFLRIYPALVIAGTDLERMFLEGSYTPLTTREAVDVCKVMLRLARQAGVPVIRMGIQPTEDLEVPGTVVAGPYHPAFRQLVESALWYDLLVELARGVSSAVTVRCAPSKVSDVIGQRRENIARLATETGVTISVKSDPGMSTSELVVESHAVCRRGSIIS